MEMLNMLETEDIDRMFVEITVGSQIDEMLKDTSNGQTDESGAATGKINGGELSDESAAELSQEVERHMVAVDPNAPSCCIDGRPCTHALDGEATTARAKVAGGALVTAYAAAELVGWFGQGEGSTSERIGRINTLLRANGINPGTHVDETAVADQFVNSETNAPKTGCGADDRFQEIITKVYDNKTAVDKLAKPLMGTEFNPERTKLVAKDAIESKIKQYDPTDIIDAVGKTESIEVLKSSHEEPNHGHREVAAVFVYKEDATLDRDAFVQDTGEQVFVVDMWYIDKLAKALASGPDAVAQYEQLKYAMVAYQVATYLTLGDGSQRAILVK